MLCASAHASGRNPARPRLGGDRGQPQPGMTCLRTSPGFFFDYLGRLDFFPLAGARKEVFVHTVVGGLLRIIELGAGPGPARPGKNAPNPHRKLLHGLLGVPP